MKNKIILGFWLSIAILYFVPTHSLWAQFAPPPPAIIVPACGDSGGSIDVEIGDYPAETITWENSAGAIVSSGSVDLWDMPAGSYTLSLNRQYFCAPAIHTYTIPQQTTSNQLIFVPGYDAVKVKVITGTAVRYRLEVQLVEGGTITLDEWQTLSTPITGDGTESIDPVWGVEKQENQQYFIVPIGSFSANYFRIWVEMADGCTKKHTGSFSAACSRNDMVADIKSCLTKYYDNPVADNFYNVYCTANDIISYSLQFPPTATVSANDPQAPGSQINWQQDADIYYFTVQKQDANGNSYITDPISSQQNDGDEKPWMLTARVNKNVVGTASTETNYGRLWAATNPSSMTSLHGGCQTAGILACGQGDQTPPGQVVGEVFMRDCYSDIGNENPADACLAIGWADIWESPDLWNTYSLNSTSQAEHVPINKEQTNNFLHVRLQNNTANPSIGGNVVLYWTVASTGEVWDEDWIDAIPTDNCKIGDRIGKITIPTPGTTNPDNSVPANNTNGKIYHLAWTPPAQNVVAGCDPTNVNETIDGKTEMCLLARFLSPQDPITSEQSGVPITGNILNSNKIVTRNTFYLTTQQAPGLTLPGVPSIIHIKNDNAFATNINFVVQSLVRMTTEQQSQYHLDLVLTQELWDKWQSTGQQGIGVSIVSPKIVRVTNLTTAKLLNIPMLSKERCPIGIRLTRVNTGKMETAALVRYVCQFGCIL